MCGAVLVENGQRLHESGAFVNQQWLWFNIAAMAAAIIGGELVEHLAPAQALHTAALIVGIAPFMVIFGTLFLIDEKRMPVNVEGMKATLARPDSRLQTAGASRSSPLSSFSTISAPGSPRRSTIT